MKSRLLSSPLPVLRAKFPACNVAQADVVNPRTDARNEVGPERHSHIALRRIRYLARFAYYLAIHRSPSSARWCLAHEGTTW